MSQVHLVNQFTLKTSHFWWDYIFELLQSIYFYFLDFFLLYQHAETHWPLLVWLGPPVNGSPETDFNTKCKHSLGFVTHPWFGLTPKSITCPTSVLNSWNWLWHECKRGSVNPTQTEWVQLGCCLEQLDAPQIRGGRRERLSFKHKMLIQTVCSSGGRLRNLELMQKDSFHTGRAVKAWIKSICYPSGGMLRIDQDWCWRHGCWFACFCRSCMMYMTRMIAWSLSLSAHRWRHREHKQEGKFEKNWERIDHLWHTQMFTGGKIWMRK